MGRRTPSHGLMGGLLFGAEMERGNERDGTHTCAKSTSDSPAFSSFDKSFNEAMFGPDAGRCLYRYAADAGEGLTGRSVMWWKLNDRLCGIVFLGDTNNFQAA